jgi:hypothetical protein
MDRYVDHSLYLYFILHLLQRSVLTTGLLVQKPKGNKKNTINYHLMRMYPKVVGPQKKEGRLG